MREILDEGFWNKRVPLMRELEALGGFQTSRTRFSSLALGGGAGAWVNTFEVRREFVNRFGFSVPCREMLEFVARLSKSLVEVGAGSGFIASQLRRFEIDVIATDLEPPDECNYGFKVGTHYPVLKLSASDAVEQYPDRDLFCSWPSLEGDWLGEAAKKLQPGRLLFYIGEGYGGCTADDAFHELVDPDNGQFDDVDMFGMVQFYGINDNLYVYRRRAPSETLLIA